MALSACIPTTNVASRSRGHLRRGNFSAQGHPWSVKAIQRNKRRSTAVEVSATISGKDSDRASTSGTSQDRYRSELEDDSPKRAPLIEQLAASGQRAVQCLAAAALSVSMIATDVTPAEAWQLPSLATVNRDSSKSGAADLYRSAVSTSNGIQLTNDENKTVNIFKTSTPSVVYITNLAVRRDAFTLDVLEVPQGTGSGFVWDSQGHIVTNYHVIKGANDVIVTLQDLGEFPARIVGFDQDKDVAVLQIDTSKFEGDLKPVTLGQSFSLQVGQRVYAIGNPFGLDHTLTTGIISGLNREISSGNTGRPIQNVIQTDAAINPGNSGGPLINSQGKVIGINTAIYSTSGTSSGVGFAIPSDTVVGIVDQIINFGRVTRPIIGISFAPDQSMELLGVKGVLVLGTPVGGPANMAGIRPTTRDQTGRLILGDVVTQIDNDVITNTSDLYKVLDKCMVGQTLKVQVLRGDDTLTMDVTLADQNQPQINILQLPDGSTLIPMPSTPGDPPTPNMPSQPPDAP
mmetsp:Transcript_42507/g.51604  ORF Transcript_42507/g.51604 Transcript_42507/m.51604 type:complete len:516 (+) Transcript_42507:119-1666(+)|eukprot:CAMPEP_0197847348 /NCGR_PEP_ID=MMETSP1438-20131217/5762_1 /TAXON_ID=1461541 /ORGANISM="Pterosperma sp., Strain CCMP1384" /LENGTH=515 /DNA_ID=CAMNT_0043459239 /DNA_START=110 /DNA_END=1657 /DNA_ORIENTATION=+